MFHLVSATSKVLTLFPFAHRLRAKGKWRILSVQTPMLQKAFNSTNWTHMQWSCQAKLLSHVKDRWGGRKTQTPLLSVYANRRGRRGKNRVIEQNRKEIVLWCKQRNPKEEGLSSKNLIRCCNFSVHWLGHFESVIREPHFHHVSAMMLATCARLKLTHTSTWNMNLQYLMPCYGTFYGLFVSKKCYFFSFVYTRRTLVKSWPCLWEQWTCKWNWLHVMAVAGRQ